jgi:hypothetical protein
MDFAAFIFRMQQPKNAFENDVRNPATAQISGDLASQKHQRGKLAFNE